VINTISGESLCETYFSEAKQELQVEVTKPSLSTVQASLIMFMASVYFGRDEAGRMYRHQGHDMLRQLHLEGEIENMRDPLEKKAYCKALWGVYCHER